MGGPHIGRGKSTKKVAKAFDNRNQPCPHLNLIPGHQFPGINGNKSSQSTKVKRESLAVLGLKFFVEGTQAAFNAEQWTLFL